MLHNVTYENLKQITVNWIKNNCQNFTTSGYPYTTPEFIFNIYSAGNAAYGEKADYIVSNPLYGNNGNVDPNTVDLDMNSFLSSIGSPSGIITEDNFYKFVNDLATFCANKLCFFDIQTGLSKSDVTRYLVYFHDNNTYNEKINIPRSTATSCIVSAEDTNTFLKNLLTMMIKTKGYIRVINIIGRVEFVKSGKGA